jgi:hypothetical protein
MDSEGDDNFICNEDLEISASAETHDNDNAEFVPDDFPWRSMPESKETETVPTTPSVSPQRCDGNRLADFIGEFSQLNDTQLTIHPGMKGSIVN